MSLSEMRGRHEGAKHGSSGRAAAMWLLLPPLLVLIVLKAGFLPHVAHCKFPCLFRLELDSISGIEFETFHFISDRIFYFNIGLHFTNATALS
jgi:hypothetical protein